MPKTNLLDVIQQGEIEIATIFLQGIVKQIKGLKTGNPAPDIKVEQQLEILNNARVQLIKFIYDVKKSNFGIDEAKHDMHVLHDVINDMESESGLGNFGHSNAFAKFISQIKQTYTDLSHLINKQQAKAAHKTPERLTKKTLNFTDNKEYPSLVSKKLVIKSTDRLDNKHK